MKTLKTKIKFYKILNSFVMFSLVATFIYVTIELILAPATLNEALPNQRLKSDYVLIMFQCLLGILAMFLPAFIEKRIHIDIPSFMLIMYTLFLYAAIYLGEVRNFYNIIPYWDTILHTFSGVMLGALGFSVVNILNKSERVPINLSPLFVAAFALCFAVTMGVLWEIYEYAVDGILSTNMQRFNTADGNPLIGRKAVEDTMKDLIVDTIGAFFMTIIGYISLKYKKGWIDRFMLRYKDRKIIDDNKEIVFTK